MDDGGTLCSIGELARRTGQTRSTAKTIRFHSDYGIVTRADYRCYGPEPGARSPEPGARSPEPGARSPEPGARSPEPVARLGLGLGEVRQILDREAGPGRGRRAARRGAGRADVVLPRHRTGFRPTGASPHVSCPPDRVRPSSLPSHVR
ncbi:hypothetical protein ASD08_40490 [Streptomyces sp. Root369]|nr:hypothetical protein ASD08_40490 [Streptomyces sp. Root369]